MSDDNSRESPEQLTLEAVFRQLGDYIVSTLRRMGVPSRYLEDALQDVLVILHRRLPHYEPSKGTLKAWLAGIATNVAAKYREREAREPVMDTDEQRPDLGRGPEQGTSDRQLALFLLHAIEPERRIVFVLHHLDELPLVEIARGLAIPEGTAATRLRLAREDFEAAVRRLRAQERFRGTVPLVDPLRLLDAERPIPPMPEGMAERVWARLQHELGTSQVGDGPAGQDLGASAPSRRASPSLRAAAQGIVGCVLFGAGVLVGARPDPVEAPRPEPAPAAPLASVAPITAAYDAPPVAPSTSPRPTSVAPPVHAATTAPARAASSSSAPDLVGERALLVKAADALAAGALDEALSAVQDHARRFPRGMLSEERDATWIAVLLRGGRSIEARQRIERFARTYPNNVRLTDLRKAAGMEAPP